MLNPLDAVCNLCPGVDPKLVDLHFRRMPGSYFEKYAAADVARHVRQLAAMAADPDRLVAVDVRPLGAQLFECVVTGADFTGVLACISTALAGEGLALQDIQLATYLEPEPDVVEPTYFVDVLRVSGSLGGRTLKVVVEQLRDRLSAAFRQLAGGNFSAAHLAAGGETGVRSVYHTPHSGVRTPVPSGAGKGQVLGNDFRLVDTIGSGGMGQVYLAHQLSLNRSVAVKVSALDAENDPSVAGRFARETAVLARFACPHIVPVFAAGTAESFGGRAVRWLAMEYLEGGDIARRLTLDGPPPVEKGVQWLRQTLEGLAYAHKNGVVHRDLKPHNLLLTADGDVKVADFGLVRNVKQLADDTGTVRGAVLGTPYYMAPEQALGDTADERSDLYAVGATFFQVFAGRLPFVERSSTAVLVAIAHRDAPRLADVAPSVPRPLDLILGRLMARRPEDRYQDARVALEDLMSYDRRGLLGVAAPVAEPTSRASTPDATIARGPRSGSVAAGVRSGAI